MHVELNSAVKNNDTVREGLMLRTESDSMAPCLYLDDLYALYEDDTGLDELITDVKLFFESVSYTHLARFMERNLSIFRSSVKYMSHGCAMKPLIMADVPISIS